VFYSILDVISRCIEAVPQSFSAAVTNPAPRPDSSKSSASKLFNSLVWASVLVCYLNLSKSIGLTPSSKIMKLCRFTSPCISPIVWNSRSVSLQLSRSLVDAWLPARFSSKRPITQPSSWTCPRNRGAIAAFALCSNLYALVSDSILGISHSNLAILAINPVEDKGMPATANLHVASNVAPVNCWVCSRSKTLIRTLCQMFWTAASFRKENAVSNSPEAGSRLILATVQSPP